MRSNVVKELVACGAACVPFAWQVAMELRAVVRVGSTALA